MFQPPVYSPPIFRARICQRPCVRTAPAPVTVLPDISTLPPFTGVF
jgi:hypothetical protein